MKLHKVRNAAAVLAGVAAAALCSGPAMAGITSHSGYQYYDHSWFSYYYENNGDDDNGNDNNDNYNYNNNDYNDDNDNINNDKDDNSLTDPPNCDTGGGDPPASVPEPGTLALGLAGLAGLVVVRLRRRKTA